MGNTNKMCPLRMILADSKSLVKCNTIEIERRDDWRLETSKWRQKRKRWQWKCADARKNNKAVDKTKSVAHTDYFWAKSFTLSPGRFMNETDATQGCRNKQNKTNLTRAEISSDWCATLSLR